MGTSDATSEPPKPEFDTASVAPLDTDGVAAIAIGTALFAIALVVALLFSKTLIERDATWWIWVCAAGFGLGILGTVFAARRRTAYRAAKDTGE
jgi:hypothetical protein